jgi:hypothetical protein
VLWSLESWCREEELVFTRPDFTHKTGKNRS